MIPKFPNVACLDPAFGPLGGPKLRWLPEDHKPRMRGGGKGQFVWPRDKGINNTPFNSWKRWKDVLSGKGPGIWIGNRQELGPTRCTWSNWDYDNLGYSCRCEKERPLFGPVEMNKKYDFRTRKYTDRPFRHGVWSDAKWEKGDVTDRRALYFRDHLGVERSMRTGMVLPGEIDPYYWNDFRNHPETVQSDWRAPANHFWANVLDD